MVSAPLLTLLLIPFVGIAKCSAFVSPTQHTLITKSNTRTKRSHDVLSAENSDGDNGVDSFLSSLPSPDAVKKNIMEGKIGERGEQYVIAQFSLLLFIAIGSVPIVGDALVSFLGPSLILGGLFLVYRSAADLKNNLSPWPTPDPQSGRGSLIDEGIYSYIRHPMYAGVLCGMTGLSILTDSVTRLVLTMALYFVLDAKSDYEETKLIEAYGNDYEDYMSKVQGKFITPEFMVGISKQFQKYS